MKDKLIMSKKELNYKSILDQVLNKNITIKNASDRLGISYRHTRRLFAKYSEFGDESLMHKNRSKKSPKKTSQEIIQKIIKFAQNKYKDFGPTLMSEKLAELDDIKINRETLRLILKKHGIWSCKRVRKKYRTRRTRKQKFGELLQLDGSIHNWLPHTYSKQCLMNLVDDATGKTLSFIDHGETTYAAFKLLKQWIELHGVPLAIYVDLKSVYVSPKELKEEGDDLVESEWLTHFTKACKRLNIKIVKAYSPQAKGRVEKNHAVYQDRFVKELKLQNITTIDEANKVLQDGFIDNLNNKFMVPPVSEEDAHIELNDNQNLDNIFTWSYERTISNDMVVRFENKYLQIIKDKNISLTPKQKIEVKRKLDGSLSLWKDDLRLEFSEINPVIKVKQIKSPISSKQRSAIATANRSKTPWGKYNPKWLRGTSSQLTVST